jgi:hypothetical protein
VRDGERRDDADDRPDRLAEPLDGCQMGGTLRITDGRSRQSRNRTWS